MAERSSTIVSLRTHPLRWVTEPKMGRLPYGENNRTTP